jgi:putrescine aminotransferase
MPAARMAFAANPVAAQYARHVNRTFIELLSLLGYGRVFTRARDVWVWDDEGVRYLDLLAGFGALNIGHNHPRLKAALQRFLGEDALHLCHVGPSRYSAELAHALVALLPASFAVCLFSTGGAQAVEAAVKIARAATARPTIVYCEGSFHGTSLGTLSVTDNARMRAPFEPLLGACVGVAFGDLDGLEDVLRSCNACAFLVEPIQAEAGVRLPPAGYLAAARALCNRYGTLLIFDEVQTGLGRTGKRFAFEHDAVVPDIVVLAKSLGGGVASIGATVVGAELHDRAYGARQRFDLNNSTFGEHAFGCVAALETLRILEDEQLAARAAERGARFIERLRVRLADHPLVAAVRGQGLLVGIEIGPTAHGWSNKLAPAIVAFAAEKAIGQWFALRLLEAGYICQPAAHAWNVLKIEPPLTIEPAEMERAVGAIGALFDEYRSVTKLLAHVTARLSRQALGR